MKPIGGELEIKKEGIHSALTDSGRSSLRLLLRSGLKDKIFIIPDYICGVVIDILDEFGIDYSFYAVNDDLTIDFSSLRGRRFDVIYTVDYFGGKTRIPSHITEKKIIVQDSVFSPAVECPPKAKRWAGFNSFRKASGMADGSIVRATFTLSERIIHKAGAKFASYKYDAKEMKYDFLRNKGRSEKRYLELFDKAERMLNSQREIFSISGRSLTILPGYYRDMEKQYSLRQKNMRTLDKHLKKYRIPVDAEYPSHYVIAVEKRDELRKYLFSKNVFLPVFWKASKGLKHPLYEKTLAIPLYADYGKARLERVGRLIKAYL